MKIKTIAGFTVGIFVVENTIQATVHDGTDFWEESFRKTSQGEKVTQELKKEFWEVFKAPDSEQSDTIHMVEYKPIKVFGKDSLVIIVK